MKYVNEFDKALCSLNSEILELKHSKEYQLGVKVSKLMYCIKKLQFKSIFIALQHKFVAKKLNNYKKNENFLTYNENIVTQSKIAVYTCITGGYDNPLEPIYCPENIDFYIITDMEINPKSKWKKIDINTIEEIINFDNTRKARYVKTHPHSFFQDYEFSIWIDSNFRVVADLSKFIKYIGDGVPFASNWHPDRNSIYTELEACILRKKDDSKILKKQVEFYKSLGMPDDFGLIETNMIVRKHNDEKCINLMESWWEEIRTWSKRDQLSLPFVIWQHGYTMKDFGFIGHEVRNNSSVQVELHAVDYRCKVE